jgi:molecular chaperone DnaJ
MSIRVPRAGDAPMSGNMSAGDLLVRVNIAPSKLWRRQGVNLYHDARVPAHTAILGGGVGVPTLDGDVFVAVQAGTQPGDEVVLRGRGVAPLQGRSKGDLYISFMVEIPRSVNSLDLIFARR